MTQYTATVDECGPVTFYSHPNGILVADIDGIKAQIFYHGGAWKGPKSLRVIMPNNASIDDIQSAADTWIEENRNYNAMRKTAKPFELKTLFVLDAFDNDEPLGRFRVFAENKFDAIEQVGEITGVPAGDILADVIQ